MRAGPLTVARVVAVPRHLALSLPLGLAVSLTLSACAPTPSGQPATPPPDTTGTAPASAPTGSACGPERRPAEQSGGHLLGDATPPVPYSSTPPTSGWHASGAPRYGVHREDDPLSEPEQVTVLELGGVVLTGNGLNADERARLEAFAAEHPGVVAVSPYGQLAPGQTAMTAWGVLRLCDDLDPEAVAAFIVKHRGGGPPH